MRITLFTLILLSYILTSFSQNLTISRTDTLKFNKTAVVPVIDGIPNDSAWENETWYPINQIWMVGSSVTPDFMLDAVKKDSVDFYGRYKVVWSAETHQLYYLFEITDDIYVFGYPDISSNYTGFDCVELFLDEDASGGNHVYDNNAFAYHVTLGADTSTFYALDLSNGGSKVNYANHFSKIAKTENNKLHIYEMALNVYDQNLQKVELFDGKNMGFSIAYCENDRQDKIERQFFIGSLYQPFADRNSSWENADVFGKAKLVSAVSHNKPVLEKIFSFYPNPCSNIVYFNSINENTPPLQIKLFNLLGVNIPIAINEINGYTCISIDNVKSGVYLFQVTDGLLNKTFLLKKE